MKIKTTIFVLFCLISCKSQEKKQDSQTIKKDTMEYFDINNYENLKIDNNFSNSIYEKHFNDGDKKIRIIFGDKTIQVENTHINLPNKEIKVYFKKNNILYAESKFFYLFQIGIDKEYDEMGNLVKEIDNDRPYEFSIDELRKKIKSEYHIDIIKDYSDGKSTDMTVNRWLGYDKDWSIYKKNVPMYQVHFHDKDNKNILLEINATTGETIQEIVNDFVVKK
jgi:uncharacterized membrane protein YkoI